MIPNIHYENGRPIFNGPTTSLPPANSHTPNSDCMVCIFQEQIIFSIPSHLNNHILQTIRLLSTRAPNHHIYRVPQENHVPATIIININIISRPSVL